LHYDKNILMESGVKERGAEAPLKFFPPLKHTIVPTSDITLFERGQAVSIYNFRMESSYFLALAFAVGFFLVLDAALAFAATCGGGGRLL
jgi:hypothetical protein